MEKRNYTHIQALLPEIKKMVAEGKPQQQWANTILHCSSQRRKADTLAVLRQPLAPGTASSLDFPQNRCILLYASSGRCDKIPLEQCSTGAKRWAGLYQGNLHALSWTKRGGGDEAALVS